MPYKSRATWLILFLFLSLLIACQDEPTLPQSSDDNAAEMAIGWFELQLKLVKETPGFTPPVASRAFGYAGLTLYETAVPNMPNHNSLVGQLNGLDTLPQPDPNQAIHWAAAANSALATIVRLLYPTATPENLAAVNAHEQQYAEQYAAAAGQVVFAQSVAYGQAVAEAIFDWSRSDGGHEGYASNFPDTYTPVAGPGKWVPTPPNFQAALQPTWGQNRPFVTHTDCNVPPPTEYSEDPLSLFYAENLIVYATVQNLTPEQEAIALFWADDPGATFTPPGHSIAIATQVLQQENANLALAAETYARVGLAVADAFIGCWQGKYTYNLIRPISYIQAHLDPTWNTPDITDPVITPPFPEYPSGHSVQSGAMAEVLTDIFGDAYHFTDRSHSDRGLPDRTYNSFWQAADEAAISRLYGGIHYLPAIELGVAQGKCIGAQINALAWRN